MSAWAIELDGIQKRYGDCVSLAGASLRVRAGAVHALVGENGAGKSTLMKTAYGMVRADAGTIRLGGEAIAPGRHSVRRALAHGLGMVHQHFMLVDGLTVAENAMLGAEPTRRGLLDTRKVERELAALGSRYGLEVDPTAPVEALSVGEQQRVEILKVLWRGCRTLILDEPTAVLTPGEVRELFAVLRALVAGGLTTVLITHKLDEVVAIAETVTVLRRGLTVAELSGTEISAEAIARAMVGPGVSLPLVSSVVGLSGEPDEAAAGTAGTAAGPGAAGTAAGVGRGGAGAGAALVPALELAAVEVDGRGGAPAVRGVSLAVGAGEIVGIAGIEGNGQSELIEAIVGLRPARGRIRLAGADVAGTGVGARRAAGLGHVPEDRHRRGLVLDFSLTDNLALGEPGGWWLDLAGRRAAAARQLQRYDVRPPDETAAARGLSGGNQQKVVLARELERPGLRALVCAQPTRGVDIAAAAAIHRRLREARASGVAILLVSAELAELRALCDRVAVIYRGAIVAVLDRVALGEAEALESLGALMTGARTGAEQARRGGIA